MKKDINKNIKIRKCIGRKCTCWVPITKKKNSLVYNWNYSNTYNEHL